MSSAVANGYELSFQARFRPFRLGLCVDEECKVTKLDIGGQAHTMGVREGWIVCEVAGKPVGSASEVSASFEACRKRGRPYSVQFRLVSPALQPFLPLRPPRPPENPYAVARTTVADIIDQGKARAIAEEERLKELANGLCTIRYELYDEKFLITDGSITALDIDNTYCFTHVMPGCQIRLSKLSPSERHVDGDYLGDHIYLDEDPVGTFRGLRKDMVYWAYAVQEPERLKKDQEFAKVVFADTSGFRNIDAMLRHKRDATHRDTKKMLMKNAGVVGAETCSCLEGCPCVDEYGCQDWEHRYAVAMRNGWKGF